MGSVLKKLAEKEIIQRGSYPSWIKDNIHMEVMGGSHSYGCETSESDIDVLGFCIPTKDILFPYSQKIFGYDNAADFKVWQSQEVYDERKKQRYDFQIYNIVHFIRLVVQNNPNMLGSIFINRECILHGTQVFEHIRNNRKKFLSKQCWPKYRGYAFSQFKSIRNRNPCGKRAEIVSKFGYDCKYAMHLVRLLLECQQIFESGDLNLMKDKEMLKAIRRGEWTIKQVEEFFSKKEKYLESLYEKSNLPVGPNWDEGRRILVECLEMHFGSLSKAEYNPPDRYKSLVIEIQKLVSNV